MRNKASGLILAAAIIAAGIVVWYLNKDNYLDESYSSEHCYPVVEIVSS